MRSCLDACHLSGSLRNVPSETPHSESSLKESVKYLISWVGSPELLKTVRLEAIIKHLLYIEYKKYKVIKTKTVPVLKELTF